MKRPIHLILDAHFQPGVSLFWRRHGLRVMEQLVPAEFSCTSGKQGLETVMGQAIWAGWKKIILIGTPHSIQRGFNVLMHATPECRNSLEMGFWPLKWVELPMNLFPLSANLGAILQVFKAGNTLPVDVMKIQYLSPKLETAYHWNELQLNCRMDSAETRLYVDEKDHCIEGGFRGTISFQDQALSSLTITPGRLTKPQQLRVYLHTRGQPQSKSSWFGTLMRLGKPNVDMLGAGTQVEIQGNWANLNLKELAEPVQAIHCEIIRRAFPLIIPVMPIKTREFAREKLFNYRPQGVVATNRQAVAKSQFSKRDPRLP